MVVRLVYPAIPSLSYAIGDADAKRRHSLVYFRPTYHDIWETDGERCTSPKTGSFDSSITLAIDWDQGMSVKIALSRVLAEAIAIIGQQALLTNLAQFEPHSRESKSRITNHVLDEN